MVADGRYLNQFPNSALVYAFEVDKGARLLLSGSLRGTPGSEEEITVALVGGKDEGGRAELWSRKLSPSGRPVNIEADVALDDLAGGIASLRLDVSSTARFSRSSVVWKRIALNLPRSEEASAAAERQPARLGESAKHLVFIILDAARYDHFGCYGNEQGMTPYIDELAKSSIIFRDAVVTAPYTITSISSLFSSLHPESHGVRKITHKFPEDLENMPRAFKRSGFYTVTLSGTKFIDRNYGLTADCDDVLSLREEEDKEQTLSTMSYAAMEEAVKKAAESGKPVFLYCHYLPPHWPYHPPGEFDSRYISNPQIRYWRSWQIKGMLDNGLVDEVRQDISTHHKRYMNNLAYGDFATHQLLELLKRYGLYEDSLIVITSDHGEAFNDHGQFGHNTTVYDEMIKVPLIVRVPGVAPREVRQQVGLIDFFPTFVELFDLQVENVRFEGRSIAPLLAGQEMEPGDYYYARAVGNNLIFMMRGERYKYIHHDYREELYDLQLDPGETVNIIGDRPALADYLRQRGLLAIAANAALRSDEGREVELSPEDEKELRNLGYLQ
jgi:arylsulfatase A-like enzyme